MAVGDLVINMKLNNQDFNIQVRDGINLLRQFGSAAQSSGQQTRSAQRDHESFYNSMRKLSMELIIGLGVFRAAQASLVDWQMGIINTNARIEKLTVLLGGMVDTTYALNEAEKEYVRNQGAKQKMAEMIELAKQTPFALEDLSRSFVKLSSVNLETPTRTLKALTDAVAAFGGDSDILSRATTALQQMAGKGVISMEELRQQLGEAVPSAISIMARELGVSYFKLVDIVSKGQLRASDGIRALTVGMEKDFKGSSERMMKTWTGMTQRLATTWTEFQLKIGDGEDANGFFSRSKGALGDLIKLLESDAAIQFASGVGDAMAYVVQAVVDATKWVIENREQIKGWAIDIGGAVAAYLTFRTVLPIMTALASGIIYVGKQAVLLYTVARAIGVTSTALGLLSLAIDKVTLSATALNATGWGKIIGVGLTAITAAAAAYGVWSLAADDNTKALEDNADAIKDGAKAADKNVTSVKTEVEALRALSKAADQAKEKMEQLTGKEFQSALQAAVPGLKESLDIERYSKAKEQYAENAAVVFAQEIVQMRADFDQARKRVKNSMISDTGLEAFGGDSAKMKAAYDEVIKSIEARFTEEILKRKKEFEQLTGDTAGKFDTVTKDLRFKQAEAIAQGTGAVAGDMAKAIGGLVPDGKLLDAKEKVRDLQRQIEKVLVLPKYLLDVMWWKETNRSLDTKLPNYTQLPGGDKSSTASGTMQFIDPTKKLYGYGETIESQMKAAGLYLRDLLDRAGGDLAKAVGGYYSGSTNPKDWNQKARAYVESVMKMYQQVAGTHEEGRKIASDIATKTLDTHRELTDKISSITASMRGRIAEINEAARKESEDVKSKQYATEADRSNALAAIEKKRAIDVLAVQRGVSTDTINMVKETADEELKLRLGAAQKLNEIANDVNLSDKDRAIRAQSILEKLNNDIAELKPQLVSLREAAELLKEINSEQDKAMGRISGLGMLQDDKKISKRKGRSEINKTLPETGGVLDFNQEEVLQKYEDTSAQILLIKERMNLTDEQFRVATLAANEAMQQQLIQSEIDSANMRLMLGVGTWEDGMVSAIDRVTVGFTTMQAGISASFGNLFASMVDGFANSVGRSIVYGENLGSAIKKIGEEAVAQLISSLVKLGIQFVLTEALGVSMAEKTTAASIAGMAKQLSASIAAAAKTFAAWIPAATATAIGSWGSAAAIAGVAILAAFALAKGIGAFETGGYTGNRGRRDVAGLVHGQEFVINARATAANRPLLERINQGQSIGINPASPQVSIQVQNYGTSKSFEVQQLSETDIRIIARDEAHAVIPGSVAASLADPNSRTSKALSQYTTASRRR